MNKIIKIILLVILSIICIGLVVTMVFMISGNNNSSKMFEKIDALNNPKMSLVDSCEASVNDIDTLNLNMQSTDVEIKESANDNISVEYYSNIDSDISLECKNRSIALKEKDNSASGITFGNIRKKVVICVPKAYRGRYDFTLGSGDVMSEIDLSACIVSIAVANGDVRLSTVGTADISSSSGDITINNVSQTVNIESASGDVYIDTLDIKHNSQISAKSGDITIKNNQCNCYIDTEVQSGDVDINKSDRKSDLVLKIKATSGDINVD